MSRADIEWYTGEGELPPYCEMTLKAAGVEDNRGDLHFCATLKGTETSSIMIERPYEQSDAGKLFLILHDACIVNTTFNILYFQSKTLIQR